MLCKCLQLAYKLKHVPPFVYADSWHDCTTIISLSAPQTSQYIYFSLDVIKMTIVSLKMEKLHYKWCYIVKKGKHILHGFKAVLYIGTSQQPMDSVFQHKKSSSSCKLDKFDNSTFSDSFPDNKESMNLHTYPQVTLLGKYEILFMLLFFTTSIFLYSRLS